LKVLYSSTMFVHTQRLVNISVLLNHSE